MSLLGRFVPSHFDDPVGLARRLMASDEPGARAALLYAALGLLALPVDRLMQRTERRVYDQATPPDMPMLFVCGPPRSGTTIVGLSLMAGLDVGFFTNVTSVFPSAPITASRVLGVEPDRDNVPLASYYGRTAGFRAPNDGLHLWDRWLGSDRQRVVDEIGVDTADAMVRFFGAFEAWTARPLVAKNNALNAHATLVARHLPTARFLCLTRDPLFLAQSLLVARRTMYARDRSAYGLHDPESRAPNDVYRDVAQQVAFHEHLARSQLEQLGPERFRVIAYEDFCAAPRELVDRWGAELGVERHIEEVPERLDVSRRQRLSDVEFEALEKAVANRTGS
jgi:hypothetical protein